MNKLVILCFLLCITSSLQSQLNIKFGSPVKVKGTIQELIPISGEDFYAIRFSGGTFGSYQLTRYSNFLQVKSSRIKMTVGNGMATVEATGSLDDQAVIFFSDKTADERGRNNNLYVQKFNADCKPEGKAIHLAAFEISSLFKNTAKFTVLASENKDFFCVEYDVPGNQKNNEKFAYKIYSKSLELVTEGEYEVPYESRSSKISTRYLSNSGDYFISCNIYDLNGKRLAKDLESLDKVILMHVKPEGLEEFEMELDGRRAMEVRYSSDDQGVLTFTGLYGSKSESGVKGIFYFRFDYINRKEIDFGFEAFSKEFITSGWSDKKLKKAERREEKGKEAPQLYNYKMRETITLSDSSVVGIMERYYVQIVSYSDPRSGSMSTTYTYFYDDLIAYRIEKNGVFDWVKKIPKMQYSSNDYGYLSSISSFVKGDIMTIIFNDHIDNYNESGIYNGNDYEINYRKNTNAIAMVEMNLTSGDLNRSIAVLPNNPNLYAVPKDFKVDMKKNQVLMLFVTGRKEQFGKLDF